MKYLALFGIVTGSLIAILCLGSVVAGTPIGPGHAVLSVGMGAMAAGIYWLFDNQPPQDREDPVTRLWRG